MLHTSLIQCTFLYSRESLKCHVLSLLRSIMSSGTPNQLAVKRVPGTVGALPSELFLTFLLSQLQRKQRAGYRGRGSVMSRGTHSVREPSRFSSACFPAFVPFFLPSSPLPHSLPPFIPLFTPFSHLFKYLLSAS